MWENFERVQLPITDIIRQQYTILEEDLKNPRDITNIDTQLLLQSLRSRHSALSFRIPTLTQWWENMLARNKNSNEIIYELEIIRRTLIFLDTVGHPKAREYLAKNPIKSNA